MGRTGNRPPLRNWGVVLLSAYVNPSDYGVRLSAIGVLPSLVIGVQLISSVVNLRLVRHPITSFCLDIISLAALVQSPRTALASRMQVVLWFVLGNLVFLDDSCGLSGSSGQWFVLPTVCLGVCKRLSLSLVLLSALFGILRLSNIIGPLRLYYLLLVLFFPINWRLTVWHVKCQSTCKCHRFILVHVFLQSINALRHAADITNRHSNRQLNVLSPNWILKSSHLLDVFEARRTKPITASYLCILFFFHVMFSGLVSKCPDVVPSLLIQLPSHFAQFDSVVPLSGNRCLLLALYA